MTDRLYYHDSFLYDFDAEVRSVLETPRPALILDRTAFIRLVAARFTTSDRLLTRRIVAPRSASPSRRHGRRATSSIIEAATQRHPTRAVFAEEIDASAAAITCSSTQRSIVLSAAFVRLFRYADRFVPHGRRINCSHRSRHAVHLAKVKSNPRTARQ